MCVLAGGSTGEVENLRSQLQEAQEMLAVRDAELEHAHQAIAGEHLLLNCFQSVVCEQAQLGVDSHSALFESIELE